jgi:hypothetical protein
MKLYYHHVGQEGSAKDFPKTVFSRIPISLVLDSVPTNHPYRGDLIAELQNRFPSGSFNCWGVPSGAKIVLSNLQVGDVVLLVQSTHMTGSIPALCEVKVFLPIEFRALSMALWGEEKYPYIFFFDTEELDFLWIKFIEDIGYSSNFDPRGKFYSVGDDRLARFNGAPGYVKYLRASRAKIKTASEQLPLNLQNDLPASDPEYIRLTASQMGDLLRLTISDQPSLTDADSSYLTQVQRKARNDAFRIGIRKLYRATCCFCDISLASPDGVPEVQSAHIYPKEFNGSDDLRNGLCLCRLHHWAFDCGWMALSDDLKILVRDDLPTGSGYAPIGSLMGKRMMPPYDLLFTPHRLFLAAHRNWRGFH